MKREDAKSEIWEAVSGYGAAARQAGSYPYSDLYEREEGKAYDAVYASVERYASLCEAEIEQSSIELAWYQAYEEKARREWPKDSFHRYQMSVLMSRNTALEAALSLKPLQDVDYLRFIMALQPLLVAYADATRAYLDKPHETTDEENALYYAMKTAEKAIHDFVSIRAFAERA